MIKCKYCYCIVLVNEQQKKSHEAITALQQARENQVNASASNLQKQATANAKTANITEKRNLTIDQQINANKGFSQQQADYDAKYNTQAYAAKFNAGGKYSQGNKVITIKPSPDEQPTRVRNAAGGYDYTQKLHENLYFSDSVIADKVAVVASEHTKQDSNAGKTRFQTIGQNENAAFLQSGSPDALAINEYFNQYKSTQRPSKTVIVGYLEERKIPLSEKGSKYIDFISGNWGNTSIDFGSSTYYDPKTNQKFSAKSGEGNQAFAQKLGFKVSPQPPSIPSGNNTTTNKPDVDALNKFFSSYKSTSPPPKTVLQGYLKERNIPTSPEGEKMINDATQNYGTSFDKGTYKNLGSTYFDPSRQKTYNAKTGEGDRILGYRVTGEKPSKPPPDPLGISGGLQSALAFAENKSVASKRTLDSNADFRTKAKAGIEQTEMEIGKYFTSIPASFVNLGGNIASYQKGSKSSEQIKVPDTAESMFISNVIETKGKNIGGSLNVASKAYAQKYGTIGLIGSTIGSAVSIYTLKGGSPIKYSKYVIPTAEKEIVASRQLSVVAGKRSKTFVGKYDKGDFFIGKPKAAKSQYEKYDIPASRGVEPSQFKPTQYEIYKSHQPYLIENKILNPNVQTSGLIEKNLAAQKGMSYTYQSEIPKGSLGNKIPAQDQAKIYGAISDVQKKGYVQGIKGGFVESSLVEPTKSKYVEQGIFQTKQKLSPEYSSQALQQVGKYPVKQFPVKDIDIEEKYLGSGYKAAAEIRKTKLSSGELSSGQGSMNVSYIQKGERSPLINIVGIEEKPTEAASMSQYSSGKVFGSKYPTQKIKIKIPSSDVESTATRGGNILGANPPTRTYYDKSMLDLVDQDLEDFAKSNKGTLARQIGEYGVKDKTSINKIYETTDWIDRETSLNIQNSFGNDFEYIKGDIMGGLEANRKRTLESALYYHEKDFGYDEYIARPKNKGEELGEKLFEPFRKMKDAELNAISSRREDYIAGKAFLEDYSKSVYGKVGTSIAVQERNKAAYTSALSPKYNFPKQSKTLRVNKKNMPEQVITYGNNKLSVLYPNTAVEDTARRGAKTVDMYSMQHQVHGLTASTTALQSEKSLKEAGKSPQQIKSILGGYKITQYPAGMREKDIVGMYGSMIKTGRHQLQAGDKSKAVSTFKGALEYKKTYEGLFDWNKEAKRFKKESSVISFASGKQGNIGGGSYGKGSVLSTQSNSVLYPRNQKQKSYSAKSYSAKSYISPKSYSSYLSPKSQTSALSFGSYLSPKSNKSVKSFGSFGSGKSVKSIGSNKSVLSIKSLGSLGSYGSPKSKGSPKSYSSLYSSKSKGSPKSYGSSKSYGSPKSFGSFGKSFYSTSGKPTTRVPLVPKILPILRKGNIPNRRAYPKREKPTQTFRWAVNNPFSKAFSIKEGKRGRRIEPF